MKGYDLEANYRWTTQDFDYELPDELVAQRPSERRGKSRLMALKPLGEPTFTSFESILDVFSGNEILVLNDTRVVPARLHGQKSSGGRVEVFFLEPLPGQRFLAMTKGRLKPGNVVHLPLEASATLESRDKHGRGIFTIELSESFESLDDGIGDPATPIWAWLEEAGKLPLPPYIQREADEADLERYQTVFAKEPGAVAAPTAGLHFTEAMLGSLQAKGVTIAYVTLHVGPGTFLPVKADDIDEHVMHSERFSIPLRTQELIRSDQPIIAVGTTTVRALESFAQLTEDKPDLWGSEEQHSTDIFITPGYTWRVIDGLLTNFHLPQSTLLMLVSAFAGYERTRQAYQMAVKERLNFYSYGDASLFWRPNGRWTIPSHFP
jgi:S-adenosylmethionine:tRNA ribosyltransferase-isomerase